MMPKRKPTRLALILLALVPLSLAACVEGTSDDEGTAEPAAEDAEEAEEIEPDPAAEAPDEIVIGNVIALSGPNNAGASLSQIPSYDLWVEDVNAAGGIYVAEYDTRIPVRIERVDDTSDIGTSVQQVQQMLESEDIHFLFPPWGTAFNVAIAPIVSEFQSPVIGCTLSSAEMAADPGVFPYFYSLLNQPAEQGSALVDLIVEMGVESVAVIHHDDLHGLEVAEVVLPALEDAGVDVAIHRTYPVNAEDLSQQLREAQAAEVEGLLAFSYPPETFLIANQLREIGFSPDLFYATVAVAFPAFRDANGVETVEGVMGAGAWNPNVDIEGARGYFDRHVEMHGAEPDRWASAACYSTGQVLEQAIEAAGTLDPEAVKAAMDTTEFSTILGTFTFENNFNPVYPGEVGQWQDGEFEIVAPAENRTADPIYPKPSWPSE